MDSKRSMENPEECYFFFPLAVRFHLAEGFKAPNLLNKIST